MIYNVIVLPYAQEDIRNIKKWYRSKKIGLEIKFIEELKQNINLIKQNPLLFNEKYKVLRVIVLNRFPYLVYYTFENNIIYIYAVIATKQDQEPIIFK